MIFMKRKFFRIVLSTALAAMMCFTSVFALPVLAETPQAASSTASEAPTEAGSAEVSTEGTGSTVSTAPAESAPSAAEDVNAKVESLDRSVQEMQDQLKKVAVEATVAVVLGFAALVLSIIALLMSLRKTVSAYKNAPDGSDNTAAWKELNQNLRQMDQQLQKLTQKQENALNAAKTYAPEPAVSVPDAAAAQPVRKAEQRPAIDSLPDLAVPSVRRAEPHPVAEAPVAQKPQRSGYLVYRKDFQNNMVPELKDKPDAGNIRMIVLTDGTVCVDEPRMQKDYEPALTLSDTGLNQVFDIVLNRQTVSPQKLSELGSLRLKAMQRPARVQKDLTIISRGVLEFEQMDYS